MQPLSRWGTLLSASWPLLAAGCAGAPTPAPAPTAPPAPTESPPTEPPAPPKVTEVGPPVATPPGSPAALLQGEDVLPSSAPAPWGFREEAVTFGQGSLKLRRYSARSARPGCPLAGGPPGCALYALAPAGATEALSFHPTPHPWQTMFGDKEAVYALSPEAGTIDRIDAQGRVTMFVQDSLKRWGQFWVFEHGEHTRLIASHGYAPMTLSEALLLGPGQARKLAPETSLPMTMVHGNSAQAVRSVSHGKTLVMAGEPRFLSLPREGSERWAMVWLEVVPPPYGPHEAPKAKHGCGRPSHGPSRKLSDPSIEKKAHVTRFDGSTLVSDAVAWTKPELDPFSTRLEVKLTGDQLSVETVATDHPAPEAHDDREARTEAGRDESVLAASFDERSHEGLIAILSQGHVHHRRFDAEGKFLAEATMYPASQVFYPFTQWSLRRAGGRWYATYASSVLPLSSGAPVASPVPTGHQIIDLAEEKGQPLLITLAFGAIHATPLDADGKAKGGPRRIAKLPVSDVSLYDAHGFVQPAGEAPWVGLQEHRYGPNGGDFIHWLQVRAGAKWVDPVQLSKSPGQARSSFVEVPGDVVTLTERDGAAAASWLRVGKSAQQPVKEGSHDKEDSHERRPAVLPVSPGEIEVRADLAGLSRECPFVMVTEKATLLACASGIDPGKPGVKASLRRVGPPPASAPGG